MSYTNAETEQAQGSSGQGIYSPEDWRDALLEQLAGRIPAIRKFDAYYRGEHKLAFTTSQFREVFGALFSAFSDNWCDLIVDASAERLRVDGFRFGAEDADEAAWEIWQRNKLDAESDMAHTEAIKLGCAYALVEADDSGQAAIQIEGASNAIVAMDPAQGRRRLAGLRVWTDEWGAEHCGVYLPDQVSWWRRESENARWQPDVGSGTNTLGVVPLIPLANAPTLSERLGRSDIERVIDVQNAINKLCGDMIVASEFAAFPQRWATGIEIPINPATGERMAAQFLGAADRVWGVESENAKFGNFAVSDLTTYVRAIEMLIQHVAAQTRTPPHYLLGAMGSFPSGESLKATETGLVAKVRRKMLSFGEGWEEAMRLAFAVEGDTAKAELIDVETIWANPESRIVGETVDAATKLASIGVPRPALWEYVGASPQQIARWKVEGDPTGAAPTQTRETISVAVTPQQAEQMAQGQAPTGPPPAASGQTTTSSTQPTPPGGSNG
jgi:Phage portal protein, SPP1 Gp6-like